MQTSTFAFTTKLASLTAALTLCGAAYAATGTVAGVATAVPAQAATSTEAVPAAKDHGTKARYHHHRHGKRMHHAAMWVPGYGPLNKEVVASLALTEDQAKLVEAAKTVQKAKRGERRDAMQSARAAKAEQFKSGKLDPQAALKSRQETHKKVQDGRREVDEKWLAVWDALDDKQRQTVATHFKERAEKFAQHAEKRKQRHLKDQVEKASS